MAVQLLPFQKLADIPDVAQRHRCAIHGLAITSIVLICMILFLFVSALISSFGSQLYTSSSVFMMLGIPSMVILFFVICVSSAISLHNTDKWVPADKCCNLMRSHPTCCTRSCSDSKHCCARLSCTHIGASVLASLVCVLFVAVLISGCNEASSSSVYDDSSDLAYYDNDVRDHNDYNKLRRAETRKCPPGFESSVRWSHTTRSDASYICPAGCSILDDKGGSYNPVYYNSYFPCSKCVCTTTGTTTRTSPASPSSRFYYHSASNTRRHDPYYYNDSSSCGVPVGFEITAIVLLISLVVTTARSAYLLRQVEQAMPEVAVLPPGKMVTQSDQLGPFVSQPIDIGNDEKPTVIHA